MAAVYTLEALGPQAPRYSIADFVERYRENFGLEGPHARVRELLPLGG